MSLLSVLLRRGKPLFWLALLTMPGMSLALTAEVDRQVLQAGETLELTLEADDPTQFRRPDLSPLEKDFEILASRQLNSLSSREGSARTSMRWVITLLPKRSGLLQLPSLGNPPQASAPLQLQVQENHNPQASLAPLFIDAHLEQDQVYVQQQALLTVRIYHSVSLFDDSSLTAPQVDSARIERLGEPRTFEKLLNGIRHGVIEVRYALYPQQSGELRIPGQVFSATLADSDSLSRRSGRRHVRAPDLLLQVRPQPPSYPPGAPWLPARKVSLVQAWQPQPDAARLGESITRSLLLKAEGLSSAQLPPLPISEAEHLRRYPDQPNLTDQREEHGLIGGREEREALIPLQVGELRLPALTLYWWNTETDSLERIELAEEVLQVQDNPALLREPARFSNELDEQPAHPLLWAWQLATAVLACTTLLGFALWWHARRQPAVASNATAPSGPSPRTLLDELKRACLSGDPQQTRQALDAWARQQPETLADMAARYEALSQALDGLNGALYSEAASDWHGEQLWQAVRNLPARHEDQSGNSDNSLPPLYPR